MKLLKYKSWILLIVLGIIWFIFSRNPILTEQYYSNGLYPYLAVVQRAILGWNPISIGDILYAVLIVWLLYKIYKFFKEKKYKRNVGSKLLHLTKLILTVWLCFQMIWGLNYNRAGLAFQTKYIPATYSTDTLSLLTQYLIDCVNIERKSLGSTFQFPEWDDLKTTCISAYHASEKKYPFFHYNASSIKKSMYGRLGNYMGFLGYYNPFTGEAQLNKYIPDVVKPFTLCHEMAHQLGYASESEASFASYLTCMESKHPLLVYSAHFDVLLYALGELHYRDSIQYKNRISTLATTVKADINTYREYANAYTNPLEPFINNMYSLFLQANNQEAGIQSYDEVVAWVNAYEEKKEMPYKILNGLQRNK